MQPLTRTAIAAAATALGLCATATVSHALPSSPAASPTGTESSQSTGTERVVGGEEVTDLAKNPGAVSLTRPGKPHMCSASRLAPKWILTARHCMDPRQGGANIDQITATTNAVELGTGTQVKIKKGYYAPHGDVALFELDSEPPGVVLGWSNRKAEVGEITKIYGWGRTAKGSQASKILKTANIKVEGYSINEIYGGSREPNDYTMRGINGSPFQGDSGGAMVDKNGRAIAVVSGGPDESNSNPTSTMQSWFSGLWPHTEWIKKTTGVDPSGTPYYFPGR